MEIIQVVPTFPPVVSGVGDYALLLAEELRRRHNLHSRFIVGDPDWAGASEAHGFPVTKTPARTFESLARLLSEQACAGLPVLLHYVGYGYEKRGCPLWLVKGMEQWRRASGRRRLVTMFHELFAFGPPWRSSFWTSPLQRRLTTRLAVASDHCVTNIRRFARYLESRLVPRSGRVDVLPVFSNVGEFYQRERRRHNEMVIFGGAGWREAAYVNSMDALIKICQALDINQIHDIGPRLSARYELPARIEWHGPLPASEVGEVMRDARFGFFTYPTPYLGKSGIFAAYASHGLVPITVDENDETNEDQLRINDHFLTCGALADHTGGTSAVGELVHAWYMKHCLAVQAQNYADMLCAF
jgi:glycosyltransferase involved in cell wall biosynthesis